MSKMIKTMGLALLSIFAGTVFADPISRELLKLRNDKEVRISTIKKKEVAAIRYKYLDGKVLTIIRRIFLENLQEYIDDNYKSCEQRLILTLRSRLREEWLNDDQKSIQEYFMVLRVFHHIDDIFYEILTDLNKDFFRLEKQDIKNNPRKSISKNKPRKNISAHTELLKANDLNKLYENFKTWPDEFDSCSYNNYSILKRSVRTDKDEPSKDAKELKHLNKKAFEAGVITLESYRKLEYFRKDGIIRKRSVWLDDYLNIIFNIKNKMKPLSYVYAPVDVENEGTFSSEKYKRFSRVTRRKRLYEKYNDIQIIMLSQVLQKASRRMGVDPDTISSIPFISQEFSVLQPSGERETYVEKIELDSQSQYNLARRLMRKDIVQLQMMDSFNKLQVTYEDIVMAALETGYISLEDIELVVKYDDLWNPTISTFEKVTGFIFRVAGYSSFFLPPPWNVVASIAMGVAEGIVDDKLFKTGVENDNPNTYIE